MYRRERGSWGKFLALLSLRFHSIDTSSCGARTCQLVDAWWTLYLQLKCCWHVSEISFASGGRPGGGGVGVGKLGICVPEGNLGPFSALVDPGEKSDFPTLLFKGRSGHKVLVDQVKNTH